jgi:hypothetical protein
MEMRERGSSYTSDVRMYCPMWAILPGGREPSISLRTMICCAVQQIQILACANLAVAKQECNPPRLSTLLPIRIGCLGNRMVKFVRLVRLTLQ